MAGGFRLGFGKPLKRNDFSRVLQKRLIKLRFGLSGNLSF